MHSDEGKQENKHFHKLTWIIFKLLSEFWTVLQPKFRNHCHDKEVRNRKSTNRKIILNIVEMIIITQFWWFSSQVWWKKKEMTECSQFIFLMILCSLNNHRIWEQIKENKNLENLERTIQKYTAKSENILCCEFLYMIHIHVHIHMYIFTFFK